MPSRRRHVEAHDHAGVAHDVVVVGARCRCRRRTGTATCRRRSGCGRTSRRPRCAASRNSSAVTSGQRSGGDSAPNTSDAATSRRRPRRRDGRRRRPALSGSCYAVQSCRSPALGAIGRCSNASASAGSSSGGQREPCRQGQPAEHERRRPAAHRHARRRGRRPAAADPGGPCSTRNRASQSSARTPTASRRGRATPGSTRSDAVPRRRHGPDHERGDGQVGEHLDRRRQLDGDVEADGDPHRGVAGAPPPQPDGDEQLRRHDDLGRDGVERAVGQHRDGPARQRASPPAGRAPARPGATSPCRRTSPGRASLLSPDAP